MSTPIDNLLLEDEVIKDTLVISGNSSLDTVYTTNKRFFIVNKSQTSIIEFDNDKIAGIHYIIKRTLGLAFFFGILLGISIALAFALNRPESALFTFSSLICLMLTIFFLMYVREVLKIYIVGSSGVTMQIQQFSFSPSNTKLKQLIKKLREKQ